MTASINQKQSKYIRLNHNNAVHNPQLSVMAGRRRSIRSGDPAREPLPDTFEPAVTDVANGCVFRGNVTADSEKV
jgi:hypothetical protein